MSKVIHLNTKNNEMLMSIDDLVGFIKRGEITSLAVFGVTREGNILDYLFAENDVFTMLGACHHIGNKIEELIE